MIDLAVLLLTSATVLLFALIGCRVGSQRLLSTAGSIALAWSVGIGVVWSAMKLGWYRPFGLLTPLVLGVSCAWVLKRFIPRGMPRIIPAGWMRFLCRVDKSFGSLLGIACGVLFAASFWLIMLLGEGVFRSTARGTPAEASRGSTGRWIEALVKTANHGFVRHIPVVGPLGDEIEAVSFILTTDSGARAELASGPRFEGLENLASFQAIVKEQRIFDDIKRAGEGDLLALYRLQRHPLIIAFCEENEVQKLILETRPSLLAKELAVIQAARGGGHRE